jgi:hypothetical protein
LTLSAVGLALFLVVAGEGTMAQTPAKWEDVVAAAKKEGVVVWSFFGAPGASTEKQSREFERLYGIRVELAPGRTGDFEARWNAERAAGKPSIDVRSSGSPENRRLAARNLDQPFGTLPALQEPGVEWIVDPLVDVKAGHGHTLHLTAGGYFLLVNNKLVPPEMGPKSYKDLEDPKYKGLILLSEPIGPSPGSRWAAYAWRRTVTSICARSSQRQGATARRSTRPADRPRRVRHLHPSHPGRRRRHLEAARRTCSASSCRRRRDAATGRSACSRARPIRTRPRSS